MTSKIKVPKIISGELQMSEVKGMKALVGQRMTKKAKFMNADIEISKLSVAEVMQIQEEAKLMETAANEDDSEENGLGLLQTVIRSSVVGADDLTDEDFQTFPMEELNKLSEEIMKFSGLGRQSDPKSGK